MRLLPLFSIIFFFLFFSSFAQKTNVIVKEKSKSVNEMLRKGLAINIEVNIDEVEDDWKDKLKNYGNFNRKRGVYYVKEAMIPLLEYTKNVRIISTVEKTDKGTEVWYTIDLGDTYLTSDSDSAMYEKAKKVIHDFGVLQVRESINREIEEAEEILEDKVDKQEDIIEKEEDLKKDLEWNEKAIKKLKKKLEEEKKEKKELQKKLEKNKQKQKEAAKEVRDIKKAIERLRERLADVE